MHHLAQAWLSLIIDISIKSMLLAGAAALALLALRLRDTNLRHRVWTAVLFGMLAMPALVYITPAVPLPGWLTRAIPAGMSSPSHMVQRAAHVHPESVARAPAKAPGELPSDRGFTSDLVATQSADLSAPETTSAARVPMTGNSPDPMLDDLEIAREPSAGAELVIWLSMFAAIVYF